MTASSLRKSLLSFVLLILAVILVSLYFSHDVEILKNYYPVVKFQKNQVSYKFETRKPKNWTSLSQISKYSKWAIIFSEDWSFYHHQGIDPAQIKVALSDMIEEKKFRGASTITQQVVKNLFLLDRTVLIRKFHEMILAYKVERVLTKARILEIYFNTIEFGPKIYGIKNASNHYFKKDPSDINPKEAAFLAMLLPSPKKYYLSFKKKKLTSFAKKRVSSILVKMRMGKVITLDEFNQYNQERLIFEDL